jgi:hypothetical protein
LKGSPANTWNREWNGGRGTAGTLTVAGMLPVLVTCTVFVTVCPTGTGPKATVESAAVTWLTDAVADPDSGIVSRFPLLSVSASDPVLGPGCCGA